MILSMSEYLRGTLDFCTRLLRQKPGQYYTLLAVLTFSFFSFYTYLLSSTQVFAIDITGLAREGISESYISVTIPPRVMLERKGGSGFCYESNLETFYLLSVGYRQEEQSETGSAANEIVIAQVGDTRSMKSEQQSAENSSENAMLPTQKCHSGQRIELSEILSPAGKKMKPAVLFFEPA